MRAVPTTLSMATARVTDTSTADYTSSNPSPSFNNQSVRGGRVALGGFSGMTVNRPSILLGSGASAVPIQFSAEL
jgi:hypothetical protein